MSWRWPVALVLWALIGVGAGFVTSRALDAVETTASEAPTAPSDAPVVTPSPTIQPDPPDPELPTVLKMRKATIGSPPYRVTYDAPRGWQATEADGETAWRPPNNNLDTYKLRVEKTSSQHLAMERVVDQRASELDAAETSVEIVRKAAGSLEFTYLTDGGRKRFGFLRWLDLNADGQADVELAVTGREVDVPGSLALIERVARTVRLG